MFGRLCVYVLCWARVSLIVFSSRCSSCSSDCSSSPVADFLLAGVGFFFVTVFFGLALD